jgi:Domain of unknown function (DUF4129)
MPGTDKATTRVVALIVLLVLSAAALRGYLPGHERAVHEQQDDSPAALFFVITLLGVSVAIVGIAIIARLRDRRAAAGTIGHLPTAPDRGGWRPTWRFVLITLGALAAWLLILYLLARLGPHHVPGPSPPPTGPNTPAHSTGAPGQSPPSPRQTGGNMFGLLVAMTVVFLLLVGMGNLFASRRRPGVAKPDTSAGNYPEPPTEAQGAESLARAAEVGLAEIGDLSREPREAIIACYAAMERELAHVPGAAPQDFDTPTEVLARAVDHHALHVDHAAGLVELFAEARFSPHVMNEGHREAAVRALRLVLEELRSVA